MNEEKVINKTIRIGEAAGKTFNKFIRRLSVESDKSVAILKRFEKQFKKRRTEMTKQELIDKLNEHEFNAELKALGYKENEYDYFEYDEVDIINAYWDKELYKFIIETGD